MAVSKFSFLTFLGKTVLTIFVSITAVIMTFGLYLIVLFGVGTYIAGRSVETVLSDTTETVWGDEEAENALLSIPVNGLILGDRRDVSGPLGLVSDSVSFGYEIKKQLYDAADNKDISGVIVEINSPGGTIYGSRAIADGLAYYTERSGNPAYAFISGLAASGGYWAALGGQQIIADYGSVIGSIGVVSGPFKYYDTPTAEDGGLLSGGVVTQNGIETRYITAGRSKDIGNPYRQLTDDEVSQLQQMVNNQYDDFVAYTSGRRDLSASDVKDVIGAMIYDTTTAMSHGLIDFIESRESAYDRIAAAAGIDGSYRVVRESLPSGLVDVLLGSMVPAKTIPMSLCYGRASVLALYGSVESMCQ